MTRLGVAAALVEGEWLPGDVEVLDGIVTAVGLVPAVGSHVVVPGFVDHQVNGFAGVDLRTADRPGYAVVSEALAHHGVVAYRPTFHSSSIAGYGRALAALAGVTTDPPPGAVPLGAHLEGPFLAPEWAGAHDPATLRPPEASVAEAFLDAGPVGLVTLAPELPGALDLIRLLVGRGVVVSLGHTAANAAECRAAVDAGATMLTHCGNAHRRFTPRDPGPLGLALTDDRIRVGLIADGVHLADETLRLITAAAGPRILPVSDAIAPAGSPSIEATTRTAEGGRGAITVVDGAATLADGTIAGSVAALDDGLRRLISLGVDAATVFASVAFTPIRLGEVAHLVVLDDGHRPMRTIIGGRDHTG